MQQFKPTYLYIKQHDTTGKFYFGKTQINPEKYNGSGVHWQRHIQKHGIKHVKTLWYCLFTNKEDLVECALLCSKLWNIVDSKDWLNLMEENGLDGVNIGNVPWNKGMKLLDFGDRYSDTREKQRFAKQGKSRGKYNMQDIPRKKISEESRNKLSLATKGKFKSQNHINSMILAQANRTEERKYKMGTAHRGKPWSAARRLAQINKGKLNVS